MASSYAFPLRAEMIQQHSNHGHVHQPSHSTASHKRKGRLPVPFALPRIPSERLVPQEKGPDQINGKQNLSANSTRGFGHHRRLHTDGHVSPTSESVNTTAPSITTPSIGLMNGKPRSMESLATKSPFEAFDNFSFLAPESTNISSNSPLIRPASKTKFSPSEAANSLLLTLPFLLLSYLAAELRSRESALNNGTDSDINSRDFLSVVTATATVASLTLMLVGVYGKFQEHQEEQTQTKTSSGIKRAAFSRVSFTIDFRAIQDIFRRIAMTVLPIWSGLQLGGQTVALVTLLLATSGLLPSNPLRWKTIQASSWKKVLVSKAGTMVWLTFSLLLSCLYPATLARFTGSATLLLWIILPSPFRNNDDLDMSPVSPSLARKTSTDPSVPWDIPAPATREHLSSPRSPMIRSRQDTNLTLFAGSLLATVPVFLKYWTSFSFSLYSGLTVILAAVLLAISFATAQPFRVRTENKTGTLMGISICFASSILMGRSWSQLSAELAISILGYGSAHLDDKRSNESSASIHKHKHHEKHHNHHHHHHPAAITKFLISRSEEWPLLHGILVDGNSRRIFYFMGVNFAFMLIQTIYGYLTHSLGLISDSIHMFFDCIALLVGLCAVVLSKWPPNDQYPFGYGKLDQLAGLGNGVFLMLVTVEILYEAFERLAENTALQRVEDLLVVSILGLLVNIYGIFAFDHGHDHGHGGHDHHHHDSDNMRGIYLHILGDALGSVGVVVSTILVQYTGWNGWDPIASCIIAAVIGFHAYPLVTRTAYSLLMALPDDVEYNLRDTLAGVSSLRGVVGYSAPKFWLAPSGEAEPGGHGHHHHEHDHGHSHAHDHSYCHPHDHSHHSNVHHHHDHSAHANHQHDQHPPSHRGSYAPSPSPTPSDTDKPLVLGVIHVIANRVANLEDIRRRASAYFKEKNMDVTVQVEREGDSKCWCGGGPPRSG
ncbi:MAG: hypothetical protein Q9227_001866 [Pyrenula ochraceoflavens]